MKNYNYFLTSEEASPYFRQPFRAKGYFCETKNTEPYLDEIPIEVRIQIPSENTKLSDSQTIDNKNLLEITAKLKYKNAPGRIEVCHLTPDKVKFQEDLLNFQDTINFISIQALNQDEIYLLWERMEDRKKIFFNGKMSSARLSFCKRLTSLNLW